MGKGTNYHKLVADYLSDPSEAIEYFRYSWEVYKENGDIETLKKVLDDLIEIQEKFKNRGRSV